MSPLRSFIFVCFLVGFVSGQECPSGQAPFLIGNVNPLACIGQTCPAPYSCQPSSIPEVSVCCRPALTSPVNSSPTIGSAPQPACPAGLRPFLIGATTNVLACVSPQVCPPGFTCQPSTNVADVSVCCQPGITRPPPAPPIPPVSALPGQLGSMPMPYYPMPAPPAYQYSQQADATQPTCPAGQRPLLIANSVEPLACIGQTCPQAGYACVPSSNLPEVSVCCQPATTSGVGAVPGICPLGQSSMLVAGTNDPVVCVGAGSCTAPYTCQPSPSDPGLSVCCQTQANWPRQQPPTFPSRQFPGGIIPACPAGTTALPDPVTNSPVSCSSLFTCRLPYACQPSTVAGYSVCCTPSAGQAATNLLPFFPLPAAPTPPQFQFPQQPSQFVSMPLPLPMPYYPAPAPPAFQFPQFPQQPAPMCISGMLPYVAQTGGTAPVVCSNGMICPAPYVCSPSTVPNIQCCCVAATPSNFGCPANYAPMLFPGTGIQQQCCTNYVGLAATNPYYTCVSGAQCYPVSPLNPRGLCCAPRSNPQIFHARGSVRYAPRAQCPNRRNPHVYQGTSVLATCNYGIIPSGCKADYFCYRTNAGSNVCCPSGPAGQSQRLQFQQQLGAIRNRLPEIQTRIWETPLAEDSEDGTNGGKRKKKRSAKKQAAKKQM